MRLLSLIDVSGSIRPLHVLQGGKFGHGFSAAGFTQAFAPTIGALKGAKLMPARVAMAAAIGGTASKLSGGKFANGAITGAFSRLFNDEMQHGAQNDATVELIEKTMELW